MRRWRSTSRQRRWSKSRVQRRCPRSRTLAVPSRSALTALAVFMAMMQGPRSLTDRQSNARPQIEKASQELRIARLHEQFCEWGRGAEQESRPHRERNAGPKRITRRNALGHGRTSSRAVRKIRCALLLRNPESYDISFLLPEVRIVRLTRLTTQERWSVSQGLGREEFFLFGLAVTH